MAQQQFRIVLEVRWEETEPDGRPCAICGDVAWLGCRHRVAYLDGRRLADPEWVVCGSCWDPSLAQLMP